MNETTTTSNPLLRVRTEDLEQVLTARKTIKNIAQKYGLSLQPHATQVVHRRSPNGSNGHNGAHKPKMPRKMRSAISVGMLKYWKTKGKKRRKAQQEEVAAPA